MPSIEELLNEAELHMAAQPVNDVLEIDPETREISIPDSEIILGVETDQKAERKYFHCPKIVGNNIDLSTLALYVVFQNASNLDEGKDRYHVTDVVTTSDGYITFSWELSAKVTAYKGDVQFGVCAIKTDSSGAKQNVWNTTIAIGQCLTGLSADMSESEEQSASDLYTQLISELNSTASAKMTEVITQIQTVGQNQVSNVNSAGSTQIQSIKDATDSALASIPSEYTELDASVKSLESAMRGKAPVITESITCKSGSPTTVTDSAEMPLQDMVLYGKSEQVVTSGTNLAKPLLKSGLDSGITITKNADGSYNFKGTCTNDTYNNVCYCDLEIGKQYTFSGGSGGSSETQQTYILNKDENAIYYAATKHTFTATQDGCYINFAVYQGQTIDVTIKPMLNLGTEALPFEPYTGGKPSPSPEYPQEIVSIGQKLSTGKNLINADDYYSAYKQEDGTYKSLVNNFADVKIPLSNYVGKKVTISSKLKITENTTTVRLMAEINSVRYYGTSVTSGKTGNSVISVTPTTSDDWFAITYGSGGGYEMVMSNLQLELGDTATEYEPYTGGVPALYETDCGIEITGKNLFDINDSSNVMSGTTVVENKLVTNTVSLYPNFKISGLEIGKKYTLSYHAKYSGQISSSQLLISIRKNNGAYGTTGEYLHLTGNSKSEYNMVISFVAETTELYVIVNAISNKAVISNIQLEEGDTVTSYEPYKTPSTSTIPLSNGLPGIPVSSGGNYTDENGQQYICDEIDFKRGKYVQRVWKGVFDGSSDENWRWYTRQITSVYIRKGFAANIIDRPSEVSTWNGQIGLANQGFLVSPRNDSTVGVDGIWLGSSGDGQLTIPYSSYYDDSLDDKGLANWKAHLADNPLVVMTYLDTPIETDLTESQLEAYKSLTTFKPTSIISNDAGAQMDVEYGCDTKTWVTNKINTLIKEAIT